MQNQSPPLPVITGAPLDGPADCTLACDEGHLTAHKIMLCAHSKYLQDILGKFPDAEHPIIILTELNITDIKILVNYMYTGELIITNDGSPTSLLRAAQILKIDSLTDFDDDDDNQSNQSPQQNHQYNNNNNNNNNLNLNLNNNNHHYQQSPSPSPSPSLSPSPPPPHSLQQLAHHHNNHHKQQQQQQRNHRNHRQQQQQQQQHQQQHYPTNKLHHLPQIQKHKITKQQHHNNNHKPQHHQRNHTTASSIHQQHLPLPLSISPPPPAITPQSTTSTTQPPQQQVNKSSPTSGNGGAVQSFITKDANNKIRCHLCNIGLSDVKCLYRHVLTRHLPEKWGYKCEFCDREFSRDDHLMRHYTTKHKNMDFNREKIRETRRLNREMAKNFHDQISKLGGLDGLREELSL